MSTSGVIPIRCGRDLLNKNSFTQNEFWDFSLMVLEISVLIYGFLLYFHHFLDNLVIGFVQYLPHIPKCINFCAASTSAASLIIGTPVCNTENNMNTRSFTISYV